MSHPETSPVAPPSIALAMKAAVLATDRTGSSVAMRSREVWGGKWWTGVSRYEVEAYGLPGMLNGSREYYRIIDRISAGETP